MTFCAFVQVLTAGKITRHIKASSIDDLKSTKAGTILIIAGIYFSLSNLT